MASTESETRNTAGQRLHCQKCSAEVEIVTPCPCDPPDLVLKCCGQDMVPSGSTAG